MKILKSIILGLAGLVALSSCSEWLDVNKNPNTPSSTDLEYHKRLPWMQFYMNHIYFITGGNTAYYCGNFYRSNARDGGAAKWDLSSSTRASNAQQWFYTQVGGNCNDLYNQAMEAGAYHYAGAAKFFRAYGFMMLTDLFGEVPYTDAFGDNPSPVYDNGKTIFMGCIEDIDEAIELFGKEQKAPAEGMAIPTELMMGDSWNGGDAKKWQKMCYLLKARWINHLIKKGEGDYKDGKYDAQEILDCLEKAQLSNADNTVVRHEDENPSSIDVLGWKEPVDWSPIFSVVGTNTNIYITKTMYDNLTNFAGNGVEDPRADKFIPWARSVKSETTPEEIKWSEDGKWRRSLGVDLQSNILSESGPYALSWSNSKKWYCDNASRAGDTVYVWVRSGSMGYSGHVDYLYRRSASYNESAMSGTTYTRPTSLSYIASYAEACFIKAEVLFRQNKKADAFAAYKEGIKANIDAVNDEIAGWLAANESEMVETCPVFVPMTDEAINNFLTNGIGTADNLTMGKIMTQKMLAMPFSNENWNDMRRHDYNTEVFLNWDKPYYYKVTPKLLDYCPEGKSPRRWQQASYELSYNTTNLKAIGAEVPGAEAFGEFWYNHKEICTLPVWWDSDQQ